MENREFFKKPLHVFLLAMLCCTLWGSAAPFIKWGYKLFNIEGVPSILMFAGIRFALAGFLVILFGSFLQKKVLVAKKREYSRHMHSSSFSNGWTILFLLYRTFTYIGRKWFDYYRYQCLYIFISSQFDLSL